MKYLRQVRIFSLIPASPADTISAVFAKTKRHADVTWRFCSKMRKYCCSWISCKLFIFCKLCYEFLHGEIAQLVEQRTENPRVLGSIPSLATTFPIQIPRGKSHFYPLFIGIISHLPFHEIVRLCP